MANRVNLREKYSGLGIFFKNSEKTGCKLISPIITRKKSWKPLYSICTKLTGIEKTKKPPDWRFSVLTILLDVMVVWRTMLEPVLLFFKPFKRFLFCRKKFYISSPSCPHNKRSYYSYQGCGTKNCYFSRLETPSEFYINIPSTTR